MQPRTKHALEILGPLEREVMAIIWERGEVTVREVYGVLSANRPLAYTTVLTTMSRLHEKGLLARCGPGGADDRGGRGRSHYYTPSLDRRNLAAIMLQRIVDEVLGGDTAELGTLLAATPA